MGHLERSGKDEDSWGLVKTTKDEDEVQVPQDLLRLKLLEPLDQRDACGAQAYFSFHEVGR